MFRSRIARKALLKTLDRQQVNVTTADIPGPHQPLYLAGAQLLEVFPVLPLIANVSLGVGALSYAGQFNMMAVADQDTCPDLDVFAAAARDELRALTASDTGQARPSQPPLSTFWRAAPAVKHVPPSSDRRRL